MIEVITNGVQEIGDNATDVERTTNREQNKDCKETFMIYQSIDEVRFMFVHHQSLCGIHLKNVTQVVTHLFRR